MPHVLSTPRHKEQKKITREERKRKPHHPLCLLPSGGPWKPTVYLVTVFTQPAGHTLFTPGSPELAEWSLLPWIPEPPHPGAASPPLTGESRVPLGCHKPKAPGSSEAGSRFYSTTNAGPGLVQLERRTWKTREGTDE